MDMNSIDDLLNFNEPFEMPVMSAQHIPNKQQCQEFIENLYNEVKTKHLSSVLCGEVFSAPPEERESVVMNQMFNVLKSYIQEVQEENELMFLF